MKGLGIKKRMPLLFVVSAYLAGSAAPAWAQKTPPAGPAPAAPAAPNAAPTGITNGSLPIESTILAYKILVADAASIDNSLSSKTAGKIVVVGTSADIAAIVQLRIVLSQASILEQRLRTLTAALIAIPRPVYANPVMKRVGLGVGFIASPADVATLIQTLGSITAVNETLSTASGALNDSTLIGLIAQGIVADSVYVPSAYPPNLITDIDISDDTYLGASLIRLETSRRDAIAASNNYLQAVKDAEIVATTVRGGAVFTNSEIDAAAAFAEKTVTVTALVNAVTLASAAADGFETSLFTGQGFSPVTADKPSTAGPTSPSPAPVAPALPAPAPAPPLPPAPAAPPPTVPQNQGQQPATASGTTLQQILSADLLLHQILSNPNDALLNLQLLSVHALESGGGQLTKSNLFLGSRIYFGGGAVVSFALYDSDGASICGGVGYGYKGNIREKNIEAVIADAAPAVATVSTTCN